MKTAIQLVDIDSVKPNPKNPRTIKASKLTQLVKSIKDFPQMLNLRPLIVDKKGYVIGGNMRLAAAKEVGLKKIPVLRAESLTPAQVKEFIIKDNVGFGDWDWEAIANEWEIGKLEEWGLDIPDFINADEQAERNSKADEIPEVPSEPVSAYGDIWICGSHRVMCGDSTKAGDVDALMQGTTAQLIHADPPYGMGKESDGVINDNIYGEKLSEFQMMWWRNFRKHLSDNASAYIWGNPDCRRDNWQGMFHHGA
jgi:hypothetical protein